MDGDGMGHLSDIEIALLLTGGGSRALHQVLTEHLEACAACRALLVESALADRAGSQGSEGRGGPATVPPDGAVARVLQAMEAAFPETVNSPAARRRIPLVPLSPSCADRPVLAAQSLSADTLPTLTSDDGSVVVHFRRPEPGGPIRAYVVRRAPSQPGQMWIVFAGGQRAFPVDSGGEADLPGIAESDLLDGRLALELRPREGEPGDPEG